jgi:hypothetical protein
LILIAQGMVFKDEIVSTTLKRRFTEEALDALNLSDAEVMECKKKIYKFFSHGTKVLTKLSIIFFDFS